MNNQPKKLTQKQQTELANSSKTTLQDLEGNNIAQYNAEKIQVINNYKGSYGIDKRFFVGFCNAFVEISENKALGKIEMNLICFILGCMGDDKMMISKNKQRQLTGEQYAKRLNTYQPHITKAFKRLEDCGYIQRVTGGIGGINILINPDFATNAGTKQYKDLCKDEEMQQLLPFEDEQTDWNKQEKQDWASSLNFEE